MRKLFFIHIMKTAGTSLRFMLYKAFSDVTRVYPNANDLSRLPNRWYPPISTVLEDVRNGRLRDFDVFIGHYPFFLAREICQGDCLTFVLLRDPVARTLSMLSHRKKSSHRYANMSYEELLRDGSFVMSQVANYQTKIFAFNDHHQCRESVNEPLKIDDEKYRIALDHLRQVDIIGLTEQFSHSVRMLEQRTGLQLGEPLQINVGEPTQTINEELRSRIAELNYYDIKLYTEAQKLFAKQYARGLWDPARVNNSISSSCFENQNHADPNVR